MNRLLTTIAAGLGLFFMASCSPQTFYTTMEMRYPSSSGYDLAGKTMSVVYLDSGRDSVFNSYMANGFASALESEYFGGYQAINVYRIPKVEGGVYSSKDTLMNLVMDSNDDVVFLFDSPEIGNVSLAARQPSGISNPDSSQTLIASFPFKLMMYTFDSRDKRDTVCAYVGHSTVKQQVYVSKDDDDQAVNQKIWPSLAMAGEKVGTNSAQKFLPTWQNEIYSFYYYDGNDTWEEAAYDVMDCKWKDAINCWMKVLGTTDLQKRSCAEYNIAAALYFMGDFNLALEWLDKSDKDMKTTLSSGLRSRIEARK